MKATLARPSVLYVDSDLPKIKVVEKLFKNVSNNSKIVFAEHAEEALEKLKVLNNKFDIIIVAEQLSLDGFLGHEFVEGIFICLYFYMYMHDMPHTTLSLTSSNTLILI